MLQVTLKGVEVNFCAGESTNEDDTVENPSCESGQMLFELGCFQEKIKSCVCKINLGWQPMKSAGSNQSISPLVLIYKKEKKLFLWTESVFTRLYYKDTIVHLDLHQNLDAILTFRVSFTLWLFCLFLFIKIFFHFL